MLIRIAIIVGLLAIACDAAAQAPQVSADFGMTKRGLPVDGWSDRLFEWLTARKLR